MQTIYHLDAETFARRDLAHQLGLVRDTIASCAEQIADKTHPANNHA